MSTRAQRRRTAEQVATLTRMGVGSRTIAKELGLTARTVLRYRNRLGLSKPPAAPVPRELWAKAEQMLIDGASYAEVERTLGRPCETVLARHFPQYGLTRAQAMEVCLLGRKFNRLERTG